MKIMAAWLGLLLIAQQDSLEQRVMQQFQAAIAPAIQQFPETDDTGASPRGNDTEALWMVRPPEPGERTIEVLANPLNEVNQRNAARAMALIERNIEAAQRRAADQYDRAVAEAKRTGRSQDVDGVTLADEGIEGAKIDAESHVTIDVAFNEVAYSFMIAAAERPSLTTDGMVSIIVVPAGAYRDELNTADRYAEAQTIVSLGRISAPQVTSRGDHSYEVSVTPTVTDRDRLNTLVVRYRGNEALVKQLVGKTLWKRMLELIN